MKMNEIWGKKNVDSFQNVEQKKLNIEECLLCDSICVQSKQEELVPGD